MRTSSDSRMARRMSVKEFLQPEQKGEAVHEYQQVMALRLWSAGLLTLPVSGAQPAEQHQCFVPKVTENAFAKLHRNSVPRFTGWKLPFDLTAPEPQTLRSVSLLFPQASLLCLHHSSDCLLLKYLCTPLSPSQSSHLFQGRDWAIITVVSQYLATQ